MGWWERLGQTLGIAQPLKEATAPSGYDPDTNLSASQLGSAYVRRLTTQTDRQLAPITQERAIELAYWLYQTNPLARRITELARDFVLGEGLIVRTSGPDNRANKAIQRVIDRFWYDPFNLMDINLQDYVLEAGLFGELLLPVTINSKNGLVRLGYIDPADIKAIITKPDNVRSLEAVRIRAKMGLPEQVYRVIHRDDDFNSLSYGRLIGAKENEQFKPTEGESSPYAGSCFYFRLNGVSNSIRGWPDMLCIIDWLDGFDQFGFNEIDRGILLKSHIWDITLKGADKDALAARTKELTTPPPGTLRVHNEKEVWTAVTPDLKVFDSQGVADFIISVIATGGRLPRTWLNSITDINRATAVVLPDPSIKQLTMRQHHIRYMVHYMMQFVLDQAELVGGQGLKRKMVGGLPEPWPIVVNAPKISGQDTSTASETMLRLAQALSVAVADGAIDVVLEQEVLALAIGLLGIDVNLETLRQRMRQGKEERTQEEMPGVIPVFPDGREESEEVEKVIGKVS